MSYTDHQFEYVANDIASAIANIRRAAGFAQEGDYSLAVGNLLNAVHWMNSAAVHHAQIEENARENSDYNALFKRAQEIERDRCKNED